MIQLQSKKRNISHFGCAFLECIVNLNRKSRDIRLGQFTFGTIGLKSGIIARKALPSTSRRFCSLGIETNGIYMRESALAQLSIKGIYFWYLQIKRTPLHI